jgi:hypothetical protein
MLNARERRTKATACQRRAAASHHPRLKAHYRSMARTWTLMARQKDRLTELLWDKKR